MKTLLISFLLTLLVVSASTPPREKEQEIDVDAILAKCDRNLTKASTVTKKADQQQKAKMVELHETVTKLEEEKKELETTLTETKHELQTAKEVINNNAVDTGERFDLFPKD
jgi:predicted  nucleic acid-binding Zn-ribbon protein